MVERGSCDGRTIISLVGPFSLVEEEEAGQGEEADEEQRGKAGGASNSDLLSQALRNGICKKTESLY